MVNNRSRSNARNIEYEKLEEDEVVVEGLLEESGDVKCRIAYMKLLGLIRAWKEQI